MELQWNDTRARILCGDVTDQQVDAIVNAANSSLRGGGGVDGAVHRKGGPRISEQCEVIRKSEWPDGLPPGKAVITDGGDLSARYVIHTVGPIWAGGEYGEAEVLSDCYRNSLLLAAKMKIGSIAFPSISTGAYGYPIGEASKVALGTVKECVERESGPSEVHFILFDLHDLAIYESVAAKLR